MTASPSTTTPALRPVITYPEVDAIHLRVPAANIEVRRIDDTTFELYLNETTIVRLDHVGIRALEEQAREAQR